MVVKGCYANICQGCTIVTCFLNTLAGVGMAAVGCVLLTNPLTPIFHYTFLGYALLLLGSLALSLGICGLVGACCEKPTLIVTAFVLVIVDILAFIGMVVVVARADGQNRGWCADQLCQAACQVAYAV